MELVIETATAACSVALIADGRLVDERHEVVGRGHAERLVPQIAELIAGRPVPALIRVDCGPGSFTGVRVGLAAARALASGWGVPANGYSAMALLAATAFAETDAAALCVAITGGHGELFVRRFARDRQTALSNLASLTPEAAAVVVPEALVVGSGAAVLVAARGHGAAREALPRAADARLLDPEWSCLPPSPLYGRAPDAKPPAAS